MTKFEIVVPCEWGNDVFQAVCDIVANNSREWAWAKHVPDENCSFDHWHVGGLLHSNRTASDIFTWFGSVSLVRLNSVEKIKSHWKTYLCYLQHKTKDAIAKGKTPPSEWGGSADFSSALQDYETKGECDTLITDILAGKVREYEFHANTALVEQIIQKGWYNKVKQAFESADKNRLNKSTTTSQGRDQCWIFGKAGCGKTALAKHLCREHGYSDQDIYITSSGSNPFDDYKGQPCVIVDDIDSDTMSPKTALKLADCFTGSAVKARYSNKVILAEVVVFTSTVAPSSWWKSLAQEKVDGNVYQLLRRLTLGSWHIIGDTIDVTAYDGQGEIIGNIVMEMPLPILEMVRSEQAHKRSMDFLASHFKIKATDKNGNSVSADIDVKDKTFTGSFDVPFVSPDDQD
jgi:hypothetical protein